MGNNSNVDYKAIVVGGLAALGGFVTLAVTFFYVVRTGEGVERWQALGMLAVAVGIAFAVAASRRAKPSSKRSWPRSSFISS